MRMRANVVLTSLLVVVALAVVGCGDDEASETTAAQTTATTQPETPATTQPETPATGGTVRIGIGGAPEDLNPGNGVLAEDYTLYELVYDTPISIDLDGNYIPELATDWTVSDDGLTWTLTLRDDALFHDGTPVTSEDVKYSIEIFRDYEDWGGFLGAYAYYFTDVQAPDPTTVVLTTDEPLGAFEAQMVFMYIVPKHIWEPAGDPVAFTNDEMIGSGSFKLAEIRQNEYVTLAANADYWGGAPIVDEVVFQTYENPDARVQALINGDADMITEFPNTAIATLEATPNVKVVTGAPLAPELRDIFFNVTEPEDCPADDGVCSGHPALRDVQVRRALAHGVDKQQMITIGLLGLGDPGLGLVPTGLPRFFAEELVAQDYAFDLAEGNALLDAAGYADTNSDGIRECPAGAECGPTGDLTLRLNYPTDIDEAPRLAELLKGWWGDLGVNVEIAGLDPDTLTSVCCPTFDYDVIIWGWGSDPDPGFLLSVLTCAEVP
ncbi:MAG: ABC transporter substrate-binding protein, partial [Actinobacteria bacterium]|nr:ABC transporter substrate-binding protein [Actinomycetota bacterium]MBU1494177.1 ABC transporter substrate-binding protein [Actinomycetota bacterium]